MARDKAIRYVVAWLALAMLGEVYVVGLAWASHAGLLGGVATGKVSVLIVEESEDRRQLTDGQRDVLFSHANEGFLAWITRHGEHDKGGAFRLVDKDDSMAQDEPKWRTAFAAKGPSVPWVVVSRGGRVLLSEAMPKTEAEFMHTVQRFGGK